MAGNRQFQRAAEWILRNGVMRRRPIRVSGLENLEELSRDGDRLKDERGRGVLYLSNHHHIILDPALILATLLREGIDTPRVVVGDNLYSRFTTWFFDFNECIEMHRPKGIGGSEARDASYQEINEALDEGVSGWMSHRAGRSYDWQDETNQGICELLKRWCNQPTIVPVSLTYELSPTAVELATYQALKAADKRYRKPKGQDLVHAAIELGRKKHGSSHVAFGAPLAWNDDPAAMARSVTRAIHRMYLPFDTHRRASDAVHELQHRRSKMLDLLLRNDDMLGAQLRVCPEEARPYLLTMYGNIAFHARNPGKESLIVPTGDTPENPF